MNDIHRPCYHFLPPSGWMNDPNGLTHWGDNYHLFYQYDPHFGRPASHAAGLKHWGHAVSTDLVHWSHLPVALTPSSNGPDKDGCYSGCAVDNAGVPTLIYTGVFPQSTCIATSTDGLVSWTKHPANPVIGSPPSNLTVTGFRDHSVWREPDGWHQVIGSGIRGIGGTVLHYTSPDLFNWNYSGQLLTGDSEHTNAMWECPDFFPLGEPHVLLVSANPGSTTVAYFVGAYADGRYGGRYRGRVDLGTHFYAPQTLIDAQGRRLMWAWLREGRTSAAQQVAGWSGVMSLPRMLDLDDAGRLRSVAVPELATLRGEHHRVTGLNLNKNQSHRLQEVTGTALEVLAEFAPSATGTVGLSLRSSPDGTEETLITYNFAQDRFELDCQKSSLDLTTERSRTGGASLPRWGVTVEFSCVPRWLRPRGFC